MEALEVFLVLHGQSSDLFRHASSASEKKIHIEYCCNVSGELIYILFRAALWAALIQNVQPLREAHLLTSVLH